MAISNVRLKDDTQVKLMPSTDGLSPTCDDRCRGPSFSWIAQDIRRAPTLLPAIT